MSFRKPDSIKDYLIHLGSVLGMVVILMLSIFHIYLPSATNHGETITVPDIQGMALKELDEFLTKRNLRYEVTKDSGYSANQPPLSVLRQVPKPNANVKENRKIYVTINSEKPPLVKMPRLEDLSLKAAQMVLKSYELVLGDISYVPDPIAFGTVHEARSEGREVLEGERIEKGSIIDLVVGDGYGNQSFESPLLIGLEEEEAIAVIIGSGLKLRNKTYTQKNQAILFEEREDGERSSFFQSIGPGEVQKQEPEPGTNLKINDVIDIWVYQPDSINNASTILDN